MQLDSVERPCEIVISGVTGEGIVLEDLRTRLYSA